MGHNGNKSLISTERKKLINQNYLELLNYILISD